MLIKFGKGECIEQNAGVSVCDNWIIVVKKVKSKKTEISEIVLKMNKEVGDICPVDIIEIAGG